MGKNRPANQDVSPVDSDSDHYPSLAKVLRKIGEEIASPNSPVERIEIYLYASGEASTKVWPPRADEPEVGYWRQVD